MTTNIALHANLVRRIAAGVLIAAAPLLLAVDTAAAAHADTTVSAPDPSFHAPAHHPAFPSQSDDPAPGTPAHHHHEHHHGR